MNNDKFIFQDKQYEFPYHYIPHLSYYRNGSYAPFIHRSLKWGFEYITYTSHILNEIEKLSPRSILDIGCGDGALLNSMNFNEDCITTGIDLSEKAISFAKAFSKCASFSCIDVKDINSKYQVVTLVEVLEHIPTEEISTFLNYIDGIIEEDGYFMISVPTDNIPLNKKHFRHYNQSLLNQHIDSNMNLTLVDEKYLYSDSKLLKFLVSIFNNRFFIVNSYFLNNLFWKLHKKFFFFSNKEKGAHLFRVYKKI